MVLLRNCILVLCVLTSLSVSGQSVSAQDSTIHYLSRMKGTAQPDSIIVKNIRGLLRELPPSMLADPKFLENMNRLKGILKPDQYYALSHMFLETMCHKSEAGEYDYPIEYGLRDIEALKHYSSLPQYYLLLKTMRDIRVPFRNSPRIYEGIETFSRFSSYFNQQKDSAAVSIADNVIASCYNVLGLQERAVYFQLKSIDYLDHSNPESDTSYLGYGYPPNIGFSGILNRQSVLAAYYIEDQKPEKALDQLHALFGVKMSTEHSFEDSEFAYAYLQAARAHVLLATDSADFYFDKIIRTHNKKQINDNFLAHYYQEKSYSFYTAGKLDSAENYILKAIKLIEGNQLLLTSTAGVLTPAYYLALVRVRQGRHKEAIAVLKPEIEQLRNLNQKKQTLREIKSLAHAYTLDHDFQNATKTWEDYDALLSDMITSERKSRTISFEIEKRLDENEKEVQQLASENKYNRKRQYYLLGILGLLILLAFGLLTRNRFKQKVNKELLRKNKEIETALSQLQSTQSQLIQAEKMASLGELTAGIAHEIQNPLNFVNNFSEVSEELLEEMKQELAKGNRQQATDLADNVKQNLDKIIYHGKRADAIVKGMLQHSRTSNGQKEPTDINALADEYLRLAYHGLRAKDKSFNATLKTDFDASLGTINVIPQDIGRVLLNLITNAFHAVSSAKSPGGDLEYVPTVLVTTKLIKSPLGDVGAEISVTDNGPGIPDKVKDKIFQPFFTTKPTGQGTGLGLSLSYDIIKAHGGNITVETKQGIGSTFTFTLPFETDTHSTGLQ